MSATSWGQHLRAEVTALEADGARLTVRGRPRGSFLSTGWGERRHVEGIQRRLLADVNASLGNHA